MSKTKISFMMRGKLNTAIDEVTQMSSLFAVRPGKDFTRERKLPIGDLLRSLFGMRGNTLNKELYDYYKDRDKHVSASAFVQQRGKLLPDAFSYIFYAFNDMCLDSGTYKGYHLYAADGTDVNIFKNKNSETYMDCRYKNVEGYNQFHVNALYDLLNRTYKDVYIQPRPQFDERKAALFMAEHSKLTGRDILIGDRGYAGYNFFEHLNRLGVNYAVRVKNADWTEIAALPMEKLDRDMSIELRITQTKADKQAFAEGKAKWIAGPSKNGKKKKDVYWDFESPFVFRYRVVRFKISEDTYETIVTNLDREEFPLEEIKKLYHMRWGIETSFRELKYAIGLVNFHARKEDYILQEIYAKLTMYNFCERITTKVVIEQKENRKHMYQVNYTMAIHICVDFFRWSGDGTPPDIEERMKKYILPIRPGRQDARKLKAKSVVYFLYRVA